MRDPIPFVVLGQPPTRFYPSGFIHMKRVLVETLDVGANVVLRERMIQANPAATIRVPRPNRRPAIREKNPTRRRHDARASRQPAPAILQPSWTQPDRL